MEEDLQGENDAIESEFILSLCWDSGKLAAAYYNLVTFELMIMNEIVDLRPDHVMLRNVFRQIQPDFLVATGSNIFLQELVELLDLPETTDISKYKINKGQTANASALNISFYPLDRKNCYRKRIYDLDLPGMASIPLIERKVFIDSILPMNHELAVITLGNLLRYMFENNTKWRHAYLKLDPNLIISHVIRFNIQAQVHIDETSFNSLNIFSNIYHPSSFKAQIRRDGLSIFNMVNQCQSSVGVLFLKQLLKQPTRDHKELMMRYSTIEWCLKPENFDFVIQLKESLKNVRNINALMGRIVVNHGRTSDWKTLKRTVFSSFNTCEISATLNIDSIRGTLLEELATYADDDLTIKAITVSLENIVDIEATVDKKRFMVKEGLDDTLDELRENLQELTLNFMALKPDDSLNCLGVDITNFQFVHFPELGFVIGTKKSLNDMNVNRIEENDIELQLQTVDATYFRTQNCQRLNNEYEQKLSKIIEREMGIFNRLIKFIQENLNDLNDIMKLCAKLDVLISFASVSGTFNFVKPEIVNEKTLIIKNGRHPLVEQITNYIPSTTIINNETNNYINVIMAPNASGKSVYMKQIAIICYLVHIGMFVPAEECTLSLLSSIFTRIYTPESVYQGESAFLADLQQLSKVVMFSDQHSLILIDEFGKGTQHKDGLALLSAAIEDFTERNEFGPIAFIATHYQHICTTIRPSKMSLKTIVTKKNEAGVFQSKYEIIEGLNTQNFSTEFPESIKIMENILKKHKKDDDYEKLTESYNAAIKAFVIILVKQYMTHGAVSYDLIETLYTKTDILSFIGGE